MFQIAKIIILRKNMLQQWKKATIACILLTLFCGSIVCSYGAENSASNGGIEVKVDSKDARSQQLLNEMSNRLVKAENLIKHLQLENQTLREEQKLLSQELFEQNKKIRQQNEIDRTNQLVLAGALSGAGVRNAGDREGELIRKLADLSRLGGTLALESVQFCELVDSIAKQSPIGPLQMAQLYFKKEELRRSAGRMITMTSARKPEGTLASCRILAVNRELDCVVLSAGSAHGAFSGQIYLVGKNTARLRVVGVRPFVTAAVLLGGNIDELAPGMEAVAETRQ